jgi:hypothetical protein
MLAFEYQNCFWNAAGDITCPTPVKYGHVAKRKGDYPDWKLYKKTNLTSVQAYDSKGYQTDYNAAHVGATTLDHYYQSQRQQGCSSCVAPTQSRRRGQGEQQPYQNQYQPYQYQNQQYGKMQQQQVGAQSGGFARPNTHSYGGSGWGDAQIMAANDSYAVHAPNYAAPTNYAVPYQTNYNNNNNNNNYNSSIGRKSYQHYASNPYSAACNEPDPADLNARQQYEYLLNNYNEPYTANAMQQPISQMMQMVQQQQMLPFQEQQGQMDQTSGMDSYQMVLMQERPYLNPNPYGTTMYIPAYANSNELQTYQPYQQQTQQLMAGGQRGGGGKGSSNPIYNIKGAKYLEETDVPFKMRLMKMVGELGYPQEIVNKKTIKVIWHGDKLKAPYKNVFYRVYLNYGDSYPVMTVMKKEVPESDLEKLSFICDRFKTIPEANLLVLRGQSVKSNLAKMALATSAIKRKISYCKICDDNLAQKWVWATNPKSSRYNPKIIANYCKLCK